MGVVITQWQEQISRHETLSEVHPYKDYRTELAVFESSISRRPGSHSTVDVVRDAGNRI